MSHKIEGTAENATEKAILVNVDGEKHWFPFSQIDWGGAEKPPFQDTIRGPVTFWVPTWLAEEKGLA